MPLGFLLARAAMSLFSAPTFRLPGMTRRPARDSAALMADSRRRHFSLYTRLTAPVAFTPAAPPPGHLYRS